MFHFVQVGPDGKSTTKRPPTTSEKARSKGRAENRKSRENKKIKEQLGVPSLDLRKKENQEHLAELMTQHGVVGPSPPLMGPGCAGSSAAPFSTNWGVHDDPSSHNLYTFSPEPQDSKDHAGAEVNQPPRLFPARFSLPARGASPVDVTPPRRSPMNLSPPRPYAWKDDGSYSPERFSTTSHLRDSMQVSDIPNPTYKRMFDMTLSHLLLNPQEDEKLPSPALQVQKQLAKMRENTPQASTSMREVSPTVRGVSASAREVSPEIPPTAAARGVSNSTREVSPVNLPESVARRSSPPTKEVSPESPPGAAGLWPMVPHDAIDYVPYVRGVELSENAPAVSWPGGFETVVPFIPDNKDPTKNVLRLDEEAVRRFADLALKGPHQFVQYLEYKDFDEFALEARIRTELGGGNTVVIAGFEEPKPFDFSEDKIIKKYGLSRHMYYDHHDPVKRLKDYSSPQRKATLSEFFSSLGNPRKIAYVLDMPSTSSLSPPLICTLDDGALARAGLRDLMLTDAKPYTDTTNTRNWDLLHGAGSHTLEHHDAAGYDTFLQMLHGCKIWGIPRPKGYTKAQTRAKLDQLNSQFIRKDWKGKLPKSWKLAWEESGGSVHAIVARPGNLVIMPPGTFHLVYTPVRAFASGGHIYTYDTMHLTEASRFFDKEHALDVTNTSHVSAFETLCFMLVYVIRYDERVFHWKPLFALCRMVANFEKYIAKAEDSTEAESVVMTSGEPIPTLAKGISLQITQHLGMDIDDDEYLFQYGSWMDPGPPVDLTAVFQEWDGTPLRPGARKIDELRCTVEQILSGSWLPKSLRTKSTTRKRAATSTAVSKSKKARKGS